MKEATGELNMTVITLVAIAAIGAVFYFLIWPLVQRTLATNSCRTAYGAGYTATALTAREVDTTSNAKVNDWCCVPPTAGTAGAQANQKRYRLSDGKSC